MHGLIKHLLQGLQSPRQTVYGRMACPGVVHCCPCKEDRHESKCNYVGTRLLRLQVVRPHLEKTYPVTQVRVLVSIASPQPPCCSALQNVVVPVGFVRLAGIDLYLFQLLCNRLEIGPYDSLKITCELCIMAVHISFASQQIIVSGFVLSWFFL